MRTIACLALLIACGIANAQDDTGHRGREAYDYWCLPCHDAGPEMPGTAALRVRYGNEKPAVLTERDDLLPEFTTAIVRNGIAVMPYFRKTEISDADLEAIAAYLAGK